MSKIHDDKNLYLGTTLNNRELAFQSKAALKPVKSTDEIKDIVELGKVQSQELTYSPPNTSMQKPFNELVGVIKEAYKELGFDKSFKFFNLNLSDQQINILDKIKINKAVDYNNYNELGKLQNEIKSLIIDIGNEETEAVKFADMVSEIVHKVIEGSGEEGAWVILRTSIEHPFFNEPRWHRDGYYYKPFEGEQYKIAIPLKGPVTLFYDLPKEYNNEFEILSQDFENGRAKLAQKLELNKAIVPRKGQGAIFIAGAPHAAIHSEPRVDSEKRIFLSIAPGSRLQIEDYLTRNKEYA